MKAIAAVSKNWVIGDGTKIPWHSKEDFLWFKEKTLDQTIVVGRKTFDELPMLKRRSVAVLSRQHMLGSLIQNSAGLQGFIAEPDLIDLDESWLCGGAEIYRAYLPKCSELFLTMFDFEAAGDVKFPYSYEEIYQMYGFSGLVKKIPQGRIFHLSLRSSYNPK